MTLSGTLRPPRNVEVPSVLVFPFRPGVIQCAFERSHFPRACVVFLLFLSPFARL